MDERTLNDLLECSVCLERLDTSSKVLPCQHTFCRKCLEVIVSSRQELRCPECRVLVEVRIEDLPPNVLLMRILEGMKNAASQNNSTKSPRHANEPSLNPAHDLNLLQQSKLSNKEKHNVINDQQQQQQLQQPQPQQQQKNQNQLLNEQQRAAVAVQPQNAASDRRIVPHAFALFDLSAKEASDLSFKKGDVILLKKKVDANWFLGELSGREGAIPINYVQIIVPLPVPQCIALYDFKMGPNEEEGCLNFKKNTIINVIRRVDHNWAEGRIGACIGIFPIAFVEMNSLAKQLMEGLSEAAPNVPPRKLPLTPSETATNDTSSSSASATSPTSTCSSSTSSSNSMPSSPTSNPASPQNPNVHPIVKYRDYKEKRHSLNAISSGASLSVIQSNRHSAEILSIPDNITSSPSAAPGVSNASSSRSGAELGQPQSRVNVLKSSGQQNVPQALPWGYLALYPYKPRKSDELELKKGCVYIVTERCLDGWFKGKNWQDKSGVFPGNYVTPLRNRDQQQLMHQRKYSHANIQTQPILTAHQALGLHAVQDQANSLLQGPGLPGHHPPELPPRIAGVHSGSVWTKPLGNHIESFFTRKPQATSTQPMPQPSKQPIKNQPSKEKDKKDATSSSSSAVSLMKRLTNIKRSKSPVSLGNCLTGGSSCGENSYSMDNPSFEDTAPNSVAPPPPTTSNISHPVHVRSGSCPSQLLQNLPMDMSGLSTVTAEQSPLAYGSQRVKGAKERPSMQSIQQQPQPDVVNRSFLPMGPQLTSKPQHHSQLPMPQQRPSNATSIHRKSQSLDANTISSQIAANYSRESRFRCIVSYPPNSDVELELNVGDIVYVHRKQKNGWFKGTHARTNKTGLFPASFVEPDV